MIAANSWYHVMNRGIAQRPVFERGMDYRVFRMLMAKGVRQFDVTIHAWSLLTNHFHFLVKTGAPDLGGFMQYVESHYAQYFNETRERDGALLRGRYQAVPVVQSAHWRAVVRYIDANPVKAGLARHACHYEKGSAFAYVHMPGRPPWMTRDAVERVAVELAGVPSLSSQAYLSAFGPPSRSADEAIEAHLQGRRATPLESLIEQAPDHVRARLQAWTRHADGIANSRLPVPVADVVHLIEEAKCGRPVILAGEITPYDPWRTLMAGLLRSACGLTARRTADELRTSPATVHRLVSAHKDLLRTSDDYLHLNFKILELARNHLTA